MALCCAAPTPGDIGGCGQAVEPLGPRAFFAEKADQDCQSCTECGLQSQRCAEACAGELSAQQFPEGCAPLVHDGEVCLRALDAASCEEYAAYMSDTQPTTASECNFCPKGGGA